MIAVVIVAVLFITGMLSGLLGGILSGGGTRFAANFTTTPGGTNTTVQFNSTATGGVAPYRYVWSFGDGNFSTIANPTHVFTPGTYTVELIVLDSTNASVTVRKNITVSA